MREFTEAQKTKRADNLRRWRVENPERYRQTRRAWEARNAMRLKQQHREWDSKTALELTRLRERDVQPIPSLVD